MCKPEVAVEQSNRNITLYVRCGLLVSGRASPICVSQADLVCTHKCGRFYPIVDDREYPDLAIYNFSCTQTLNPMPELEHKCRVKLSRAVGLPKPALPPWSFKDKCAKKLFI